MYGPPLPNPLTSQQRCLLYAELTDHLPSGSAIVRAQCPASWQTAAAVNGTTFISYDLALAANGGRFNYFSSAGKRILLLEPARTNQCTVSNFSDTAPANDFPDGWTAGAGTIGVDFSVTDTGAPHGGAYFVLEDTAVASRGCYNSGPGILAATQYAASAWYWRDGAGTPEIYAFEKNPGTAVITLAAGPYDWTRQYIVDTSVGGPNTQYACMWSKTDPTGTVRIALPQVEAGSHPLSWIPTAGAAGTRLLEYHTQTATTAMTATLLSAGHMRLSQWVPRFASTTTLATVQRILTISAADYINYDSSDQTVRFYNNNVQRATSAALTFDADDCLTIDAAWGSWGTRIAVNDVPVTDATAWTAPGALTLALGTTDGTLSQGQGVGGWSIWA